MLEQVFLVADVFVAGHQPHILGERGDTMLVPILFEPIDEPRSLGQHQSCLMAWLVVLGCPVLDHLVERYRIIAGGHALNRLIEDINPARASVQQFLDLQVNRFDLVIPGELVGRAARSL